ncbi:MAG: hypothetical protein JXB49_17475 [Bacteroidales bacterium]|nr:hypothetical protein [Bacteroidales bacterium]
MKKKILVHAITTFMVDIILKKYIFIFALALYSWTANANPPMPTKQQIGMFKNSKTCVVLEDGSISYNVYIKDAVQKYWKATEFEFISHEEFEQRRFDSKYSFLVLMKGVFGNDPGGVSYNYISLVLGDKSNDMTNMPELCSFPLSYTDNDNMDYGYVIPAMVKFMQKHAKNLETKRFIISLKGLKYYNGSASFKEKVLLLNKDMMAPDADSPEKINTVYPYYVKLLTSAEIQEEIASNPANALFNFHVGPAKNSGAGKCFEMIFDIYGNLYYYNYRNITNENVDGLNLKNFKHFRKRNLIIR